MIELLAAAAALLALLSDGEEDEAADHNFGGMRVDNEDHGVNRVESINKLLVLRVVEVAILVLRPRSLPLCCRPLSCRRRCCRRYRRRR